MKAKNLVLGLGLRTPLVVIGPVVAVHLVRVDARLIEPQPGQVVNSFVRRVLEVIRLFVIA